MATKKTEEVKTEEVKAEEVKADSRSKKAIVTGKVKVDGEVVKVGTEIDVKLDEKGNLPPSLINKVQLKG